MSVDKTNLSNDSLEHIALFIQQYLRGDYASLVLHRDGIHSLTLNSQLFSDVIIFWFNTNDRTFNGYVNNGGDFTGNTQNGNIFIMCHQSGNNVSIRI